MCPYDHSEPPGPSRPAMSEKLIVLLPLLGAFWLVNYAAGGAGTPFTHLFYLPIAVAGFTYGLPVGMTAALAASILSGPLLPLDVAASEAQPPMTWAPRAAVFLAVGALAGGLRHRVLRRHLPSFSRAAAGTSCSHQEGGRHADRISGTVQRRAFHTVFQPIHSLDDGRLIAVEALTRFDGRPARTPDLWFAEAETAGMSAELEHATLELALESSTELPAHVSLNLNVSPRSLLDPGLVALLERHSGRRLVIELTEHVEVLDYEPVEHAIRRLRARDLQIAVDDAGAGFASLRHIVTLRPDIIKLDRSLTRDIRDDPARVAVARSLVQFAHAVGSKLVVEGIETEADLTVWSEVGADAAQGFLLGRPGPLPTPHAAARVHRIVSA